jgi:hypothetical protein
MSNSTNGKKSSNGTTYRASNPPNRNGNGAQWDNFGNVFLDGQGKYGTLYLELNVNQLKVLLAEAQANAEAGGKGIAERKVGLRRRDKDAGRDSAPNQEAA